MEQYDFSSVLAADRTYTVTKRLVQHWFADSFSYRTRVRPDHGLLLVRRGQIRFAFGDSELLAKPGDLVYLPQGTRYEACVPREYGQTEDMLVNFEADLPAMSQPTLLLRGADAEINAQLQRLIHPNGNHSAFYVMGQFYILLDRILEQLDNAQHANQPFLRKAHTLLSERYDLSVAHIAKECGVSESGLRGAFGKAYGVSPRQFRVQSKLEKAKYLLESTDRSVSDISQSLGFYDEAYFCKLFRKYTGISPGKFAARKSI